MSGVDSEEPRAAFDKWKKATAAYHAVMKRINARADVPREEVDQVVTDINATFQHWRSVTFPTA